MTLSDFVNYLAWGRAQGPSKKRSSLTPEFDDPQMEALFQEFYANEAAKTGLAPNPDDPEHYYDYRGAFLGGQGVGTDGHWPSQYKMIGHPREFLPVEGKPGYIHNTRTGDVFLNPVYWRKDKGQAYYMNQLDRKPRKYK